MSVRLQGVLVGSFVGLCTYAYTYKDFWSAYENVAQDISKLHYTINPNVIPLPKKSAGEPTTWLVGFKEESSQSQGRSPSEAWNSRVRDAYKQIATKLY